MKSEEEKKRANKAGERQRTGSEIDDPEHVGYLFLNDELACRWIWLGKLLCDLDDRYDGVQGILRKPDYGAKHRKQQVEICKWMHELQRLLSTDAPEPNAMRRWRCLRDAGHLIASHCVCAVGVILYRQFFETRFLQNSPMTIARIITPSRELDGIVRAYQGIIQMTHDGSVIIFNDDRENLIVTSGFADFLLSSLAQKKEINEETTRLLSDRRPVRQPDKQCEKQKENLQSHQSPQTFAQFLQELPSLTPAEMYDAIRAEGYIGQDDAVRAVCMMAWRHVNRIRRVFIDKIGEKDLPPKSNVLLMGPTGTGKTFLIELLFSRILKLPTLIADSSCYTEVGYVGGDIESVIGQLIRDAKSIEHASVGIICLDEFDKLACAGGSGSKDLKLGVQHQLLKLFEKSYVTLRHQNPGTKSRYVSLPTTHIPFICCGAFSGLWRQPAKQHIGFVPPIATNENEIKKIINDATILEQYGILPELYGRFSSVTIFNELTPKELSDILRENVVGQYERELAANNMIMRIEPDVYNVIVEQCIARQTGARGIQSSLSGLLEHAMFDAYSYQNADGIRIYLDGAEIKTELIKKRKRKIKQTLIAQSSTAMGC